LQVAVDKYSHRLLFCCCHEQV